ncbi:hypothetical protein EWM64_g7019 [Hericium alpestre]|uniref:NAD(P)-binding protein n=1 Tax=Hericium alpestre TaxID=135208 RepID=A0A4Y9ZRU7_9AGAM|nr:hypothetical protein EWM64_g7019 [Hericium alpestre]
MSDLSNSQVWFITGASSGLGKSLLEALLAEGSRAVATVRKPDALSDLQAKYKPEQLLVVTLDVMNPSQIEEAFRRTKEHFQRLDVVVNNAGYGLMGEIEMTPEDLARQQIEVLFWGPVHAIPFFREVNPKGHGGRILNISSAGGYSANATLAFYSAGKFALEGFTQAFTREMPPEWNIKGIIIEPGGFQTGWRDANLVHAPAHPAYGPDSPGAKFRNMAFTTSYIGDIHKAAQAMIRIAREPDPPLRLQLGTDSFGIVAHRANATLKEQERWAELSHSTNLDGFGTGPEILEAIKEALD